MTPEELDKARAEEARRIFVEEPLDHADVATIAARLAREGWMPVDPDLLAVREIVAKEWSKRGWQSLAASVQIGDEDVTSRSVVAALAAYKAGKEAGK